jgi:phosphoribosylanthranilate isomerase
VPEVARTRIKICGITRMEDALMVVAAGADAIGLNFYSGSSRFINAEQARDITRALPPLVTTVGLFVNMDAQQVCDIADSVMLDLLQFHGDETRQYCSGFERPWIKALRVHPELDLAAAVQAYDKGRGILLDAWHKDAWGGTGSTFDWRLLEHLQSSAPVVLAGGLNPGNVRQAVMQCRPWAVDVSSGVESAPGIKSPGLVAEFIAEVRAADAARQQAG